MSCALERQTSWLHLAADAKDVSCSDAPDVSDVVSTVAAGEHGPSWHEPKMPKPYIFGTCGRISEHARPVCPQNRCHVAAQTYLPRTRGQDDGSFRNSLK